MQKKWLAVALVSALVCSAATAVQAEVKIGERIRKQRDLAERDRDFQRRQRELREDFNQRRNEELQKLLRQANTVIKNIAQREKYDLILQEAIYVNPKIDITDQVLKELK